MRTREVDPASLVSLADISEIELVILRRLREVTLGDHRSASHGTGFDFVGLREWQAGDRFAAIDWAQSTLTNFAPLMVREFDQPSTATVLGIVDRSLSTRCGVAGALVAAVVARAAATIGMSAVFFQDAFGLLAFDGPSASLSAIRPRTGKSHLVHCLHAYQHGQGLEEVKAGDSFSRTVSGYLRRKSLVPVISDFLFENQDEILRELALLNVAHDVFLVLVDSAFAFRMPAVSAGWIETMDVETGAVRTLSRRAFGEMGERVHAFQNQVADSARARGLDLVRLGLDQAQADIALSEFVVERRLRRMTE